MFSKIFKRLKRFSNRPLAGCASAPCRKQRVILRPRGCVYDLEQIRDGICEEYFNGPVPLAITWSGSGSIPRTAIRFGSYCHQKGLIRVNRVLDSKAIPPFFLRYIVFHEILHYLYPPKISRWGRRDIHHTAFKSRERQFRQYVEAQNFLRRWKRQHMGS